MLTDTASPLRDEMMRRAQMQQMMADKGDRKTRDEIFKAQPGKDPYGSTIYESMGYPAGSEGAARDPSQQADPGVMERAEREYQRFKERGYPAGEGQVIWDLSSPRDYLWMRERPNM